MSSTNKTTYYELPQFVNSDIFNPLVDDNDAYAKIDTALHNIADAEADNTSEIVGIKSRLDSAEGDIDALETQNGNSVLTTTAQTLSGAVNELDVDTSALDGRLDAVEDDINNVSTGLKVKVASAENDIDALETQNGSETLTTTAQTLSGAVNELDEESNVNANNISSLVNTITGSFSTLKNRKFIFCGDSYAAGTYGNTGWIDLVVGYLGLTTGVNAFDSRSISTYFGGSFGAGTFNQQLTDVATIISDPNEITDVCIFAGQNEHTQTDTDTANGIDSFCATAKSTFPNAIVHIGFIGKMTTNENAMETKLKQYIEGACRNGAIYVNNIECVNRQFSDFNADNIHPNDYHDLARYITLGILTGTVDVIRYVQYSNITTYETGIDGTCPIVIRQHNHQIDVMIRFTLNDVPSIAGSQSSLTGDLIGEYPVFDYLSKNFEAIGIMNNSNTTTTFERDIMAVVVKDHKLYLRNLDVNSSGWVSTPASSSLSTMHLIYVSLPMLAY